MFALARSVHCSGKSVIAVVPSRPTAIPRKSASVPIVTASDGSPTTVTRKPLNGAGDCADEDGEDRREREGQARLSQDAGHHAREPDDRGDRQVDLFGDDDERHRKRDQQDRRDIAQQVGHRQRAVEVPHRGERDDDHQQQSAMIAASRVSRIRRHAGLRMCLVDRAWSRHPSRRSSVDLP